MGEARDARRLDRAGLSSVFKPPRDQAQVASPKRFFGHIKNVWGWALKWPNHGPAVAWGKPVTREGWAVPAYQRLRAAKRPSPGGFIQTFFLVM